MNKLLFFIGFVIVGAMVALAVVPRFVDWSAYRGTFEREASRVLGREVRVGGTVRLEVFPSPFVTFENLRVADAEGRFVDPLVRARSVTVLLDVAPLLRGTFKARRVDIDAARVAVRADEPANGDGSRGSPQSARLFSRIELPDVQIRNSSIALVRRVSGSNQTFDIDEIDGVLSAGSLKGPFKFAGTIGAGEGVRSFRISTSTLEDVPAGQRMDLIAQFGHPAMRANYRLKGKLAIENGMPALDANLEGTVSLPAAAAPSDEKASASSSSPAGAETLEIKSKLALSRQGLQLGDIVAGFETQGRPQVINGNAVVTWSQQTRIVGDFTAAWLDLSRFDTPDRAAGRALLDRLREAARVLTSAIPSGGSVSLSGLIRQAAFRDGSLSNIRLGVSSQAGEPLRVDALEANLPGASRLAISGTLSDSARDFTFVGDVRLQGRSLKRFSRWSLDAGLADAIARDGFFSLRSKTRVTQASVQLSDAALEVSGTRLNGALFRSWALADGKDAAVANSGQAAEALNVTLRSNLLDLRALGLAQFEPLSLLASAGVGEGSAEDTAKASAPRGEAPPLEVSALWRWLTNHRRASVKLRVGQLVGDQRRYRDVVADLGIAEGTLYVGDLRVASDGIAFEAKGDVKEFAGTPSGALAVKVGWGKKANATPLLKAVGDIVVGPKMGTWITRLDGLVGDGAAKLAGRLTLGGDGLSGRFGGFLGSNQVFLRSTRKAGTLDGHLSVTNEDGRSLRRSVSKMFGLAPGNGEERDGTPAQRGQALVTFRQTAGGKAVFSNVLTHGALTVRHDGDLSVGEAPAMRSRLTVSAPDVARLGLSSWVSLFLPPGAPDAPILASARVNLEDARWTVSQLVGRHGQVRVLGELAITSSGSEGAPAEVSGSLRADHIRLADAVEMLTAGRDGGDRTVSQANDEISREAFWSDRPLTLEAMGTVRGSVKLEIGKLHLGSASQMAGVAGTLSFSPRSVGLQDLRGRLAAGSLTGSFELERQRAGVALKSAVRFKDLSVRKLLADVNGADKGRERMTGRISGDATITGKALSWRGLATVADGAISLSTKDLTLYRFSPAFVQTGSVAVLARRGQITAERVQSALERTLEGGGMRLGDRSLDIKIADGVVSVPALSLDTPVSKVTNRTLLSLSRLRLDSAWRVQPKLVAAVPVAASPPGTTDASRERPGPLNLDKRPLPAVGVVFTGSLAGDAPIKTSLSILSLARELTVRKLEQDVGELEKLRKREQEIAAELERQRVAEEARLAAEREAERAAEAIKQQALAAERARQDAEAGVRLQVLPPGQTSPEPLPN